MTNENRAALTVRPEPGQLRNKNANVTGIQRSQSRVGPVTTCRELCKGTKTTDRHTLAKILANLVERQAMPVFVEKSNKEQRNGEQRFAIRESQSLLSKIGFQAEQ